MKVEIDKDRLTKGFQSLIDKSLSELKVYADKWYEHEDIPNWMSPGIVEWVDAVDKINITNLQVRKDDIGNNFYVTVDAVLDSIQRFDIDEILQHISYMMQKKMFGIRSGHQIVMISDNVELKNTDPQW
jgi:hypothetical protein